MRASLVLILTEVLILNLTCTSRVRVRRHNLKVRITATGDTIVLKFLQLEADARLEGYILGYGSGMFSKQFIQLPEEGEHYETEIDAEPKYLIVVRPVKANNVKKKCTGKVSLEKPLHLMIGTVTPTSVQLSWGTLLNTPYTDAHLDDCIEDGDFTVRYKEKETSKKWNYETCPTTDTVIDNLKPDTPYEFEVRAETETNTGTWSPPVIHNTADIHIHEPLKSSNPLKPQIHVMEGPKVAFPPVTILHNITPSRQPPPVRQTASPPTPRRNQGQDISRNSSSPVLVTRPAGPKVVQPVGTKVVRPVGPKVVRPVGPKVVRPVGPKVVRPVGPKVVRNGTGPAKWASHNSSSPVVVRRPVGPTVVPALVSAVVRNETHPMKTDSRNPPRRVARPLSPTVGRNRTSTGRGPPGSSKNPKRPPKVPGGVKHQGLSQTKPTNRPRKHFGSPGHQRVSDSKKKNPNQVEQSTGKAKITDLKQVERLPVLKPQAAPSTEKTTYQKPTPTSMPLFAFNGSRFDAGPNSSIFRSVPVSDVDALGKKRFVAPHVFYKDKGPAEPCSVTQSLSLFPEEENEGINVTGPPKTPPSNVTVVTVEGCPSFVIVDWEKTDNETTEYEVSTKGPNGKEISVVTTNQTHTAVENLKPQSNYEFTVTPKNELGAGPSTDPVSFSTESADPRVSDIPTGKTAIWSSFPFKADSYTECNGRQFVKRTWYRKFVGIQLCNSLRYKIYLSDSLKGKFYTIGDQTGYGEDHCQFVDSYLDGRTGGPLLPHQLPPREGFFRSMRQEPVRFGKIGGNSQINYVAWYECGVPIPGSW
ncbi:target of Nesh-SH3 isoform X3 [Brachyhypopomus gauderio]|uniref:target of Nesh-SH3 isoform X3 n=1 Tax=Brachyhypopomus gauderio TaxID=698409 RepID=UPI00404102FE